MQKEDGGNEPKREESGDSGRKEKVSNGKKDISAKKRTPILSYTQLVVNPRPEAHDFQY